MTIPGTTNGGVPFAATCNVIAEAAGLAPPDAPRVWTIEIPGQKVPPFLDVAHRLSSAPEHMKESCRLLAAHIAAHLGPEF